MIGAVLLPILYLISFPLLRRWIDSGIVMAFVCILLFIPFFVVSHALAELITACMFNRKREQDVNKRIESDS